MPLNSANVNTALVTIAAPTDVNGLVNQQQLGKQENLQNASILQPMDRPHRDEQIHGLSKDIQKLVNIVQDIEHLMKGKKRASRTETLHGMDSSSPGTSRYKSNSIESSQKVKPTGLPPSASEIDELSKSILRVGGIVHDYKNLIEKEREPGVEKLHGLDSWRQGTSSERSGIFESSLNKPSIEQPSLGDEIAHLSRVIQKKDNTENDRDDLNRNEQTPLTEKSHEMDSLPLAEPLVDQGHLEYSQELQPRGPPPSGSQIEDLSNSILRVVGIVQDYENLIRKEREPGSEILHGPDSWSQGRSRERSDIFESSLNEPSVEQPSLGDEIAHLSRVIQKKENTENDRDDLNRNERTPLTEESHEMDSLPLAEPLYDQGHLEYSQILQPRGPPPSGSQIEDLSKSILRVVDIVQDYENLIRKENEPWAKESHGTDSWWKKKSGDRSDSMALFPSTPSTDQNSFATEITELSKDIQKKVDIGQHPEDLNNIPLEPNEEKLNETGTQPDGQYMPSSHLQSYDTTPLVAEIQKFSKHSENLVDIVQDLRDLIRQEQENQKQNFNQMNSWQESMSQSLHHLQRSETPLLVPEIRRFSKHSENLVNILHDLDYLIRHEQENQNQNLDQMDSWRKTMFRYLRNLSGSNTPLLIPEIRKFTKHSEHLVDIVQDLDDLIRQERDMQRQNMDQMDSWQQETTRSLLEQQRSVTPFLVSKIRKFSKHIDNMMGIIQDFDDLIQKKGQLLDKGFRKKRYGKRKRYDEEEHIDAGRRKRKRSRKNEWTIGSRHQNKHHKRRFGFESPKRPSHRHRHSVHLSHSYPRRDPMRNNSTTLNLTNRAI